MEIESVATSILSAQIFPGEQERLEHTTLRFELLRFIANAMRRFVPLEVADSTLLSAFLESALYLKMRLFLPVTQNVF